MHRRLTDENRKAPRRILPNSFSLFFFFSLFLSLKVQAHHTLGLPQLSLFSNATLSHSWRIHPGVFFMSLLPWSVTQYREVRVEGHVSHQNIRCQMHFICNLADRNQEECHWSQLFCLEGKSNKFSESWAWSSRMIFFFYLCLEYQPLFQPHSSPRAVSSFYMFFVTLIFSFAGND